MPIDRQHVAGTAQKHQSVEIKKRFLKFDRADVKNRGGQDQRELNEHQKNHRPAQEAAEGPVGPIDEFGGGSEAGPHS